MFKDSLDTFINQLVSDTLAYDDSYFQANVTKLHKAIGDDFYAYFRHLVEFQTTRGIFEGFDDEEFMKGVKVLLSHQLRDIKVLNGLYSFRVELVGHEEEGMSLADLGYMILIAFNADGSHLFDITYRGDTYICDAQDQYDDFDQPYAADVQLALLKLRKGSRLDMNYDYGENWQFKIKVLNAHSVKHITKDADMSFGEGAGMNIWEDNHYDFDRYFIDPVGVKEEFEENGWDVQEFAEDVYDKDQCNSDLLENFYNMKTGYESKEPNFFDEVEEDDFGPLNQNWATSSFFIEKAHLNRWA